MNSSNYQRILNFVDVIHKNPKKNIKYFYFDENKKFIVDGKKIKLLPLKYQRLIEKDSFHIHANPVERICMYYAYNNSKLAIDSQEDEEEGFIPWSEIEGNFYSFFVINIKELADTATPYSTDKSTADKPEVVSSTHSYKNPTSSTEVSKTYEQAYQYSGSYSSSSYKEREAFYDKINDFIKNGRTTSAIDFVAEHFNKMMQEKKFEDLDTLIRLISFEKINIPTMFEILAATTLVNDSLKERQTFFNKVKNHILKIKPSQADNIMRKFIQEPKKVVSNLN